jgi:glycosyltransferase domain-containing protein
MEIIIPTYNRPSLLNRILQYYSEQIGQSNYDYKIIIGDSSDIKNKKINEKIILSFNNIKLRHILFSSDINAHIKIGRLVNETNDKWCVICADDDFVAPYGIEQSIDFLRHNPDYICAQGHYIFFYTKYTKDQQTFFWKPVYSTKSIETESNISRLTYHLTHYNLPTLYAVHNSKFLKKSYNLLSEYEIDPSFFGELFPSLITILSGKMKCINVLYGARDASTRNIGNFPSIADYILTNRYQKEYKKFSDGIAQTIHDTSNYDLNQSYRIVNNSMNVYLKKYYRTSWSRKVVDKINSTVDNIIISKHIEKNVNKWNEKQTYWNHIRTYKTSDKSIPKKQLNDFLSIRKHVLFHLNKK